MIRRNDENNRSQVWRIVMPVSSIAIVLIVAYFLIQMFTQNPIKGIWCSEDSDFIVHVGSKDTLLLEWPEEYEGMSISVKVPYELNMDSKVITIREEQRYIEDARKKTSGNVSAEEIEHLLSNVVGSYTYNMENNQLVLQDREYGSQMIFTKKQKN